MKTVCVWFPLRQIRFIFCLRFVLLALPPPSLLLFIPYIVGMHAVFGSSVEGFVWYGKMKTGIWLVGDKRRGENLNSSFLVQTARQGDGFNRELIIEEVFADSGTQV